MLEYNHNTHMYNTRMLFQRRPMFIDVSRSQWKQASGNAIRFSLDLQNSDNEKHAILISILQGRN